MEHSPVSDTDISLSYLPRNSDFEKDTGAGELQGLKNLGDDIRLKVTHIESLGLGIIGTVQVVSYGTWEDQPACLVGLRINQRRSASASAFRRIEIIVSCDVWSSQSSGQHPVLRNFSPREHRVRLNHEHGSWAWEPLQRSWIANPSHLESSHAAGTSELQTIPGVSGTPWSSKRRMAPHQILWTVESGAQGQWQIPDQLDFAFVVQYDSTFKATVEVSAKTKVGLPFPFVTLPWSKDDPLLFNGRSQIGKRHRTRRFDLMSDQDWADLALYLPEWHVPATSSHSVMKDSVSENGNGEKQYNQDFVFRVRGIPGSLDRISTTNLIREGLLIREEEAVKVRSLTESPYRSEKIATATFTKLPSMLGESTLKSMDEWQFVVTSNLNSTLPICTSLVFDTHFRGFTPLNHAYGPDVDYKAECVVIKIIWEETSY